MLLITAYENGPFVLKGRARYQGGDRIARESVGDAVALCRCGRTAAGPLCDGTHRAVGFNAPGCELSVELPDRSESDDVGGA